MTGKKRIFWWSTPLLCVALGAAFSSYLYLIEQAELPACIAEGALCAILAFASMAVACLLIHAYPTNVGLVGYAAALGLIEGALAAWMHDLIAEAVTGAAYERWLYQTVHLRIVICLSAMLLFCIITAMRRRMRELQSRYALQQHAAALLKEAELFKLRQQLQPHFLYNSLNAISSLMIIAPQKAEEMISRLSCFLRASVTQGGSDNVPLAEELDYLNNYLWIEAVRFGERLNLEWNGLEVAPGAHLPPFLLQPLLENAIKYGLYGQTEAVTISITIAMQQGMLLISFSNPFDSSAASLAGTGFGIEGIRRRLYLMYARQDLLRISVTGNAFTATLLIPQ